MPKHKKRQDDIYSYLDGESITPSKDQTRNKNVPNLFNNSKNVKSPNEVIKRPLDEEEENQKNDDDDSMDENEIVPIIEKINDIKNWKLSEKLTRTSNTKDKYSDGSEYKEDKTISTAKNMKNYKDFKMSKPQLIRPVKPQEKESNQKYNTTKKKISLNFETYGNVFTEEKEEDKSEENDDEKYSSENLEDSIITSIFKKDYNRFINLVIRDSFKFNYEFWDFKFDTGNFTKILNRIDVFYGSLIVRTLLGFESLGAYLWKTGLNEKNPLNTLPIIIGCLFKNIVKKVPTEAYNTLFKISIIEKGKIMNDEEKYMNTIISTPRIKFQEYSQETSFDLMNKTYELITSKNEEELLEIFLKTSKMALLSLCNEYFREKKIPIHKHASKNNIHPYICTYMEHSISSFKDFNMYMLTLLFYVCNDKDKIHVFPYVLEIIVKENMMEIFSEYEKFYGKSVMKSISSKVPKNIFKLFQKILEEHKLTGFLQ